MKMRWQIAVAVTAFVLAAVSGYAADEKPTGLKLTKGETFYVPAELKRRRLSTSWAGGDRWEDYSLNACEPLTVKKYRAGKKLDAVDDFGMFHSFKGEWSKVITQSQEVCRKVFDSPDKPRVRSDGIRYTLHKPKEENRNE